MTEGREVSPERKTPLDTGGMVKSKPGDKRIKSKTGTMTFAGLSPKQVLIKSIC